MIPSSLRLHTARPSRRLQSGIGAAVFLLSTLLNTAVSRAIIVLRSPGRNLTEPTGDLADSGWQYEGEWLGFPGTPIGPHHFLTAAHVAGFPGRAFWFRGKSYIALECTRVPRTDIAVWRIAGTFPAWAALYEGRGEINRPVVFFGRGGARGDAVIAHGAVHGWRWGPHDYQMSWGRSVVRGIWHQPTQGNVTWAGRAPGDLLLCPFDPTVGPDSGCVTGGDSGGGAFIRDAGQWKLAGVIFGVERSYTVSPTTSTDYPATAIFDGRGLYRGGENGRYYVDPSGADMYPTTSFLSRVSTHAAFIGVVMRRPLRLWRNLAWAGAVLAALLALGGGLLWRRRRKRRPRRGPAPPVSDSDTNP